MINISRQPEDVNLFFGDAEVSVGISGGRPVDEYLYEWRDAEDNIINNPLERDPSFTIEREGEYHCEILVDTLPEPPVSDTITAFNTEPLKVTVESDEILWRPEEEGSREIRFFYRGGREPYTLQHYVNGTLRTETTVAEKEWDGVENAVYDALVMEQESEPDIHVLSVTDGNGQTCSVQTLPGYYPLEIEEQPVGGMISGASVSKKHNLSIRVAQYDGEAPFTYILCNANDGSRMTETKRESRRYSFPVEAGRYFIRVEDANGVFAQSDTVTVLEDDGSLRIRSHTEEAVVKDYEKGTHLRVSVEGGKAPYTYQLECRAGDPTAGGWKRLQKVTTKTDYRVFNVIHPENYRVVVTDDAGAEAVTGEIRVSFEGDGPYITKQPHDTWTELVREGGKSARIAAVTCEAASSTGDNSGLSYSWQKKGAGTGGNRAGGYGVGQTMTLSATTYDAWTYNMVGTYRCHVYDQKTYRSVDTIEVDVYKEFLNMVWLYDDGPNNMKADIDCTCCRG